MLRASALVLFFMACDSAPEKAPERAPDPAVKKLETKLAELDVAQKLTQDQLTESVAQAKKVAEEAEQATNQAATAARLEQARLRLEESRALAEAYRAGALGERLAEGELVLVDARVKEADQVQFYLFDGTPSPMPTKKSEAGARRLTDSETTKWVLLGGDDSARPGLFRGVKPGAYTACAVASPPKSPAEKAQLERAMAAYKAEHGEKLDAEKLQAAVDRMKADPDYVEPKEADWDALPLRCQGFEVTKDAGSRVVVLAGK